MTLSLTFHLEACGPTPFSPYDNLMLLSASCNNTRAQSTRREAGTHRFPSFGLEAVGSRPALLALCALPGREEEGRDRLSGYGYLASA